jgi:hypothetical protein
MLSRMAMMLNRAWADVTDRKDGEGQNPVRMSGTYSGERCRKARPLQ